MPDIVIVNSFPGTGYSFKPSTDSAKLPKHYGYDDFSFHLIKEAMIKDPKVEAFFYYGCQVYGGGTFAYGVNEIAQECYTNINSMMAVNRDDNIRYKILMVAHSRGCISSAMAIHLINANLEFKEKIEWILDWRDPVPGNFQWATFLDSFTNITAANNAKDLTGHDNISQAYITIAQDGFFPVAFTPLIPAFHSKTQVEVTPMLGLHDIQESLAIVSKTGRGAENNKTPFQYGVGRSNKVKLRDPNIFNLGLMRSYSILANWGILDPLQAFCTADATSVSELLLHGFENQSSGLPHPLYLFVQDYIEGWKIHDQQKDNKIWAALEKKDINMLKEIGMVAVCKEVEKTLYDRVFQEEMASTIDAPAFRRPLFGGDECLRNPCSDVPEVLNERHAWLSDNPYLVPLLTVKTDRPEINVSTRLDLNIKKLLKSEDKLKTLHQLIRVNNNTGGKNVFSRPLISFIYQSPIAIPVSSNVYQELLYALKKVTWITSELENGLNRSLNCQVTGEKQTKYILSKIESALCKLRPDLQAEKEASRLSDRPALPHGMV